jgi:hypothetical protein
MSTLNHIEKRHGRDRWKDALFVGVALLLTAISIGSVTSKAAGKAPEHAWSIQVIESNPEIQASR